MRTCFPFKLTTLLYILTIICALLGILSSFADSDISNSWFKFSFVFLFFFIFVAFFKDNGISLSKFHYSFAIVPYIIWVVLISYLNNSLMLFNILVFWGNILMLFLINFYTPSIKEFVGFIVFCNIAMCFFAYTFFCNATEWWYTGALSIGSFNPQSIGCWAYIFFCTAFASSLYVLKFRFFFKRILQLAVIALMIYMFAITVFTCTRTAAFSIIFVVVMHFIRIEKIIKLKIFNALMAVLPLIIAVASLLLFEFGIGVNLSGGTLLNGRESRWIESLSMLKEHPIIGNFFYVDYVYTHNITIDYLICYGVPVTCLFCVLLYHSLLEMSSFINSRIQYDLYIFFLGCIICSSGEGLVFSVGCGGMFFIAYSFLFFVKTPGL